MTDYTPGRARPKSQSFRASIATLVIGSVCLALITLLDPHLMLVAFLTMLMLIALPFALAMDFAVATANRKRSSVQFSLRQLLIAVTCFALYISLLREPWTFRLRFAISRPALERLAAQVEHGASPDPQWGGLFFINKASREESGNGETLTVLWTEPDGGSPSGFAHPAPKPLGHVFPRFPRGGPRVYNDWSTALQNDPEWFYFIED